MKELYKIPLKNIERVEIFANVNKLSLQEIANLKAPDLAIEGAFYEYSWAAACHLKAGGKVLSNDPSYVTKGYAWDGGPDIKMYPLPGGLGATKQNYITCCFLGENGVPSSPLYYNKDVGGARCRGAMGMTATELCFYACTDGTYSLTPEQLRGKLFNSGLRDAIMLDGGGKVNYYNKATGTMMQGKEKSQNLILVYLKKEGEKPVSKTYTVCLDPGHGPDTINGSPDGTYKEHEFCWDMYTRIKPILEKQGIKVVGTRSQNEKPSLIDRCKASDNSKADLFLSLHSNAEGGTCWGSASGLIAFTSSGPDAAQRNVAARALLDRFREAGVSIRGTRLAHNIEYVVLAKTAAPACLIEYGFHTNQGDVAKLKDEARYDP